MRDHERQALLDRVERDGATVGATIPERIELDGESIPLRDRIHALQRAEDVGDERDALLSGLRRRRGTLKERLETEDLEGDAAEALADRIVNIDRARAVLRSIGSETDIEDEMRKQRVADAERWRSFVKRTSEGIDRSLGR